MKTCLFVIELGYWKVRKKQATLIDGLPLSGNPTSCYVVHLKCWNYSSYCHSHTTTLPASYLFCFYQTDISSGSYRLGGTRIGSPFPTAARHYCSKLDGVESWKRLSEVFSQGAVWRVHSPKHFQYTWYKGLFCTCWKIMSYASMMKFWNTFVTN